MPLALQPLLTVLSNERERDGERESPISSLALICNSCIRTGPRAQVRAASRDALPALAAAGARFDLVYIDGSHRAADVLMCPPPSY